MKKAEEKVKEFMRDFEKASADDFMRALVLLLKEQDRDTRHACAEAVLDCTGASYGDADVIWRSDAERACMNTKAV